MNQFHLHVTSSNISTTSVEFRKSRYSSSKIKNGLRETSSLMYGTLVFFDNNSISEIPDHVTSIINDISSDNFLQTEYEEHVENRVSE